jgi:iron complex outermembrane recepter protein
VNVTSKRPTSNYQGSVAVEYGNYDYTHATLVGNVPVTDDFWIRLAVNKLSHSGFETTGADSRDEYGARLSMLYTPSDALTAYLWMNFDSQQGHPENGVNKGLDPATLTLNNDKFFKSNPWNDTLPAQYEIFGPITAGERHYQEGTISGQIDYKFDDLTLTYIPSYTRLDSGDTFFLTALPFNYQNTSINYSNELRLTNDTDGAWKWLTGLYEYGFDAASPSFLANEGDVDNHVHSSLYGAALFGQSTYSITDSFRATAGGRLSFDHRDVSAIDPVAGPFQNSHSFRSADWKIGTDYNVTDKSLLYANIQTGDQVGTFNVFKSTPTIDNFVKSPHILSFSVGSKNRFLDDRLEIDDEVYHYIYKNLIVSAFDAQVGGRNFNAQRVLMWGNELSAKYYITPADKLDISVGYLNARNDKFITPFPVNGQTNFDGLAPAYAPDWTVSAGFEHIFDLDSGASVVARVDTYFESEFAGDFIHSVGGVQAAYTKTDVSVTYNSPDGQWNVGIWAKNLENAAVEGATATGGSPGPVITFPQDPRTFGVRGSIAFGK